jgi:hypothetical protein
MQPSSGPGPPAPAPADFLDLELLWPLRCAAIELQHPIVVLERQPGQEGAGVGAKAASKPRSPEGHRASSGAAPGAAAGAASGRLRAILFPDCPPTDREEMLAGELFEVGPPEEEGEEGAGGAGPAGARLRLRLPPCSIVGVWAGGDHLEAAEGHGQPPGASASAPPTYFFWQDHWACSSDPAQACEQHPWQQPQQQPQEPPLACLDPGDSHSQGAPREAAPAGPLLLQRAEPRGVRWGQLQAAAVRAAATKRRLGAAAGGCTAP